MYVCKLGHFHAWLAPSLPRRQDMFGDNLSDSVKIYLWQKLRRIEPLMKVGRVTSSIREDVPPNISCRIKMVRVWKEGFQAKVWCLICFSLPNIWSLVAEVIYSMFYSAMGGLFFWKFEHFICCYYIIRDVSMNSGNFIFLFYLKGINLKLSWSSLLSSLALLLSYCGNIFTWIVHTEKK